MPNPMEEHRLLVLGSMHEFVGLVRAAQARGWWCAVADGYSDGPAKSVADARFDIDVRDTDALVKLIRDIDVDGCVASFSDVLFENLCRVTHASGLYSYCPLESMPKLRDKRLMGAMFNELGIPRPASRVVRAGHVAHDLEGMRWPCVMKPVDGYGSYGIRVVAGPDDVERFFDITANVTGKQEILVEEYDDAPEINMISWVANGVVHPISLADREKCPLVENGVPDVVRIVYPSVYALDAAPQATHILQLVADHVGMQDGPLSMQFFWHPDTQSITVCEVAGRVLGYEHELTEIGAGFSIDEALLDLTYDRPAMRSRVESHRLENFSGVSFVLNFHALPAADGVVSDTSIASALAEGPDALAPSVVHYAASERVSHGKGAKPYLARIFCHTETREEADELTARMFRSFSMKDLLGNELAARESLPFMEEWDA